MAKKIQGMSTVWFALILVLIIILIYYKLPSTFYQQDEWQVLGAFMTGGIPGYISSYSFTIFNIIAGKGRLLSVPLQYFFYHSFPFQVVQVAVFAMILHFLNSVILFIVFSKLFKNTVLAVVAVVFFTTASVASQSITWMAASITTLVSAFFAFSSLLSYSIYLERKREKWIWITFGLFIISFFFKESSIFFLFIYPITYMLYYKGKASIKVKIRMHLPFFLYLFLLLVSAATSIFSEKSPTGMIVTASPDSGLRMLLHLMLYPFIAFSQVFVGGEVVYRIADSLGALSYSRIWNEPYSIVVKETIAADFVSVLFSFLLLVMLFFIGRLKLNLKKPIVWGTIFTLLSFLPYAVLDKQTSYFESRYYYYAVAGGGVLFGAVLVLTRYLLVKYFKTSIRISYAICLVVIGVYVSYQINLTHASINRDLLFAQERKMFLKSLDKKIPLLQNKAVFYIVGNTEYFHENNKMPFQQGIGYTLMIWYYDSGTIPNQLIRSNFLWVIGSEGYQAVGDKGFGIYSDYVLLKKEVNRNNLSDNNVYGLYYDGKKQELFDISDMVRRSLKDSSTEKELMLLSNI